MTTVASVGVVEFTDPVCSWAWGTEPKLRLLRWRHGHHLSWRTVMGGLIGDAGRDRSDWNPVLAAKPMQAYWSRTSDYTGQPFPMPMHRMARSTDPAGRAVKAALEQGESVARRVLRRLRESTFIFGTTPDTPDGFAESAKGVPGLDVERWLADFADAKSQLAYELDWNETRRPNDHVRFLQGDDIGIGSMKHSEGHDRYAFPTLVFSGPGGERTVPGWMPYTAYVEALELACPGVTSDARPDPTPAEAFAEWGVLTAAEYDFLCGPLTDIGDPVLPTDVWAHNWGRGLVYFSASEAAARGLPPVSPASAQSYLDFTVAVERASGLVDSVPADGWHLPTPCSEWDVRALVNHMVGGVKMVAYGLSGREIGTDFYGDHLGGDPASAYRAVVDEIDAIIRHDPLLLERVFPMPWGQVDGSTLVEMFMADHVVHAWDLARSLGTDVSFEAGVVERARRFAGSYVDQHRGPGMFDVEATVADGTGPLDRLAAFAGRHLDFRPGGS